MTQVEILNGRAVLRREGGDELRREAQVLTSLAGPGVPEILALDDDGDTVRLATAIEPPLPLPPTDVRSLVAEVATVLGRAHAAGIVHGPLRDEHLHGRPGAVVVDGWHAAGPGDPADDVAELGRLIERLAGGDDPHLQALATRAMAPGAPSMAALAATPPPPPAPSRARPTLPVVGLAVAAVVVAVGLVVGRGGSSAPASTAAPGPSATVARAPSPSPTTTDPADPAAVAPAAAVTVTGNVLERAGERWTVGRPGDVVVVGDWSCTGVPLPAVLRPATGQVWTFGAWLGAGTPTAGRLVATVPGAVDLEVERSGGCDRLRAVDAQGRSAAVG